MLAGCGRLSTLTHLIGLVSRLARLQPLDEQDLEPAMAAMREHLISKNVASDIADSLCKSVAANLIGKKPGTFKGNAPQRAAGATPERCRGRCADRAGRTHTQA